MELQVIKKYKSITKIMIKTNSQLEEEIVLVSII